MHYIITDHEDFLKEIESLAVKDGTNGIEKYLTKAAAILQIELPNIHVVPYIYLDGGLPAIEEKRRCGFTLNAYWQAGHFFYLMNEMILAAFDPNTGKKIDRSTMLFTAAHELRHAWQYENAKDKGYIYEVKPNYLIDPLEIDADAFAYVFMESFPGYLSEGFKAHSIEEYAIDGGLRYAKTAELRDTFAERLRYAG